MATDAHHLQPQHDHMPGRDREAFRSAEWAVIQESIQNAVQSTVAESNRGLREDLKEFRSDIKTDIGGLRGDVSKVQLQLSQGDGMFKLMDQRVKWLEEAHERVQAAEERAQAAAERAGLMGDTSRIQRAISDAKARDKATSDDSGKRRKDDKDRLLISPKVINAFILAFVAAAGASVWALLEHTFSPPASPTPPGAPSTGAPVLTPGKTTGTLDPSDPANDRLVSASAEP